jgi:carboxyl-terminal processing protease
MVGCELALSHHQSELVKLTDVLFKTIQRLSLIGLIALGSTLALAQTQTQLLTTSPASWLFNRALTTLQANYFGYAPLDTGGLREQYLPRLENACEGLTECPFEAVNDLISEMISSIGDPHTYRLAPDQAATINRDFGNLPSLTPSFGMTVDAMPDAPMLVVKRVRENGPAFRADLRRGDVILGWNGSSLSAFGSVQEALKRLYQAERDAETLQLEVRRAGQGVRTLEIAPVPLQPWPPQLEMRPNGMAVITFYQFKASGHVARIVHQLVARAINANARGIVLDVRDSAGGLISECLGVLGAFMDNPALLDEFRDGRYRFEFAEGRFVQIDPLGRRAEVPVVNQTSRWTGPLVVLTNDRAKSAPEYLAYLLQRARRARVVGEPTLGALDTSNGFFPLPDGSAMAVSMGRSLELSGTPFPKRVKPDITSHDDLAALAAGRDLTLELAVRPLDGREAFVRSPRTQSREY